MFKFKTDRSKISSIYTKTAEVLLVGKTGLDVYRVSRDWWVKRNNYEIYISDTDPSFWQIINEISPLFESKDKKSQQIASHPDKFVISWSSVSSFNMRIKGHTFDVFQTVEEAGKSRGRRGSPVPDAPMSSGSKKTYLLGFRCKSQEGVDVLMELLEDARRKAYNESSIPRLYVSGAYESWRYIGDVPFRSAESVFLKEGQLDYLLDDLQRFQNDREKYEAFGISYHRGYLLYGPPGTGKSTVPKIVAHQTNLPLYYVTLSSLSKDTNINDMFSELPKTGCVLLLEDLDTSSAVRDRDEDKGPKGILDQDSNLTLSAMLNVLDGMMTPENMVVFITTNDKDVFDEAMLRKGRIDVMMEIGYLDNYQMRSLMKYVMEEDVYTDEFSVEGLDIAPADIMEIVKSSWNDLDKFLPALRQFLKDKREQ